MNTKDINNLEKKQFFLDSISKFCDKCGTPYTLEDVNIIQNTEVSAIIHFSCHNCKSKNIVTHIAPLRMSSKSPLNTDLNFEEIGVFAGKREVSLDEILEVYTLLKSNSKISL